MSGHTVRQEFIKEFRGLDCNSRARARLIVASYALQTLAAIGCGYWLLSLPLSAGTALGIGAVMFFIATRLRGLNNIVHECSHFAFSRDRESNVVLGSIAASLVLGCFRDYRDEHLTHHAHLGDYDHDLDLQGIRDFRLEDPLTPRTILRHLLTALTGRHLPYYLNVNLSARDGAIYRAGKIALIAAATVFLAFDPLAALLLVWFPFVWIYSAMNYWTDCIDHGGLVGSEDELDASRNFILPRPIRALLFPRNDCYHLIHHLFPQVPSHHFEECHQRLMSNPEYQSRAAASAIEMPHGELARVL